MLPGSGNHSSNTTGENSGTQSLTPELVRQVTDKVYQLFLRDLKIENERRRVRNSRNGR
ncbi:MAG: hypothetical protein R6X34_10020 [Chloroflexota bacterium]|jgi:hypothetical protein